MARILIALCWLLIPTSTWSQELVPNGSFEEFTGCPLSWHDIDSATHWTRPTEGTSDYFNACNKAAFNVPNTIKGYQKARSGVAFAGLANFLAGPVSPPPPYREYIQTPLKRPLYRDSLYVFEMYVSAADKEEFIASNIGVCFRDQLTSQPIRGILPFTAPINNPRGNYPDTTGWLRISGVYKAHGGERYLIIGNFQPDGMVDTIRQKPPGSSMFHDSYLFVDDVSLMPAGSADVYQVVDAAPIILAPNPAGSTLRIRINTGRSSQIAIIDLSGHAVMQTSVPGRTDVDLNIAGLPAGVYQVRSKQGDGAIQTTLFSKQ